MRRMCEHFGCREPAVVTLDDCDPKGERVLIYSCKHHAGDLLVMREGVWKAQALNDPPDFIGMPEVTHVGGGSTYLKFSSRAPAKKVPLVPDNSVEASLDEDGSLVALTIRLYLYKEKVSPWPTSTQKS